MSDPVSRLLAAIDETANHGPSADLVLRLCQAHRDIVALHAPEEPWSGAGRIQCAHCASLCHSETGLGCELDGDAPFPCKTVILLARGYGIEDGEGQHG